MNNLLDIVKNWANRLTYRILVISGTSTESLGRYKTAIEKQDEDIIQNDKELNSRVPFYRFVVWVAGGIIVIAAIKWLKKR